MLFTKPGHIRNVILILFGQLLAIWFLNGAVVPSAKTFMDAVAISVVWIILLCHELEFISKADDLIEGLPVFAGSLIVDSVLQVGMFILQATINGLKYPWWFSAVPFFICVAVLCGIAWLNGDEDEPASARS